MAALLSLPAAFATNQPAAAHGAALASGEGAASALDGRPDSGGVVADICTL